MDPTGRCLKPAASRESLGERADGKPKKESKETEKQKKPPTYTGKANSKLSAGRSALTDAKFWLKKIREDQELPDPAARKMTLGLNLLDRYLPDPNRLQCNIDTRT